jgi:hypothetical protein
MGSSLVIVGSDFLFESAEQIGGSTADCNLAAERERAGAIDSSAVPGVGAAKA